MMTVLITGASSGIGAGLAKSFAADGHPVIACGRDPSRLAALQRHSPNISLRSFDMTDRESCRRARGVPGRSDHSLRRDLRIPRPRNGRCRAGGTDDRHQLSRAGELPGGASAAAVCRQSRGAGKFNGALAALSSRRGVWCLKAALTWFANSLRLDWEPKGIAITVVSPGFVDTPLTRKNDFSMPGQVSVEHAVKAIRRGLAKGKNHIVFPTGFGMLLRLLAGLPEGLQRLLLRRMVRS